MNVKFRGNYIGTWGNDVPDPLLRRIMLAFFRLSRSRRHFWIKYHRGLTAWRGRCGLCGVTADWDQRHALPAKCEDMRDFLLAAKVMES